MARVADDALEAKWRMVGDLDLPWRPRLDLRGTTRYTLRGEGGRISRYDETWGLSAGDALRQLVAPAAPAPPAFWPGREAGAPPPPPRAVAPADAPTVVVLPGFGNDQVDYRAPLGLPEECGLVARPARASPDLSTARLSRGARPRIFRPRVLEGAAPRRSRPSSGAASPSRSRPWTAATGSRCSPAP